MEINFDTAIAIGAAIIAAMTLISRMTDKSLSVREHEEYKRGIEKDSDRKDHQRERDFDIMLDRIKVLEQTRPTTGELEARLKPNPPPP